MKYLTNDKYSQELEKIKRKNRQKLMKRNLQTEKSKYRKRVHIETSKLIAIYLFILLNAIVIYAMISMWKFADLSYLGVLITDIAAQILIYGIYCMKAYKGKKSEEEMKFKRERYGTLNDVLSAGAESQESVPLTNGDVTPFSSNVEYDTEEVQC